MAVPIESFGIEVEFPVMTSDGQFRDWDSAFDELAGRRPSIFPNGGKLYHDGTPCAEYASGKHTSVEELLADLRGSFGKIMEAVPNKIFFIGSVPYVRSTFSGHIHLGKPNGMTNPEIEELAGVLKGSQTLIELMSQNMGRQNADERGISRNYHQFVDLTPFQFAKGSNSYTYNELKTLECRIPPSSDFYHLITILTVIRAWNNHYKDTRTLDLHANYQEAMTKGVNGKYFVFFENEMFEVGHPAYMHYQLSKIMPEIDAELKTYPSEIRQNCEKYLNLLQSTTMTEVINVKTVNELITKSKALVYDNKSYIDDVKIKEHSKIKFGRMEEKTLNEIMDTIKSSRESMRLNRFRKFVEAVKTENPSIADVKDAKIVQKILNDKKMEMVI